MYWSLIFSILNYLLRFGSHIGDAVCNGPFVHSCILFFYNVFKISACCYTFLVLNYFHVALFPCCGLSFFAISDIHFSLVALSSCWFFFRVTLFPCCPFSISHSFYFSLFLSFFMFSSCYTFFNSHIFGVALY